MGAVTHSNLDDVFSYHKPKGDFQIEKYHRIRQGAKECAKVILETDIPEDRIAAVELFKGLIERETGDCRDRQEALGMLEAAGAFVRGIGVALSGADPTDVVAQVESAQAVISCIRAAVMWANASVALEGRV